MVVLVALLIGGALMGLAGAILAIPTAALLAVEHQSYFDERFGARLSTALAPLNMPNMP